MSKLSLPLWVGLRYTRSRQSSRFLSLLSWFSLFGMAIGVAALIVVMSVMNGFQKEVRDRLLDLLAHGQIEQQDYSAIENWQSLQSKLTHLPMISASAPMVGGEAMISRGTQLRAAVIQGVDVELEQTISPIAERMIIGDWQTLEQQPYGIVLGDMLAKSLYVGLGDQVLLTLPQITITPFGAKPRVKQFVVTGIFQVGADVDLTHAYIRLSDAQKLFAVKQGIHALRFTTENIMRVEQSKTHIAQQLPNQYQVKTWADERAQLFAAIRMEKRMIGFMLAMVVLVAACNLVSLLSMMVADKRSEIAVMRMMGMSRWSVVLVFLAQGLGLALLGITLGAVLGVLIANGLPNIIGFFEQVFGLYVFDPDVFYISGLPSDLFVSDVIAILLMSLILSVVFSIYPALQASKIQAVEALQYQ